MNKILSLFITVLMALNVYGNTGGGGGGANLVNQVVSETTPGGGGGFLINQVVSEPARPSKKAEIAISEDFVVVAGVFYCLGTIVGLRWGVDLGLLAFEAMANSAKMNALRESPWNYGELLGTFAEMVLLAASVAGVSMPVILGGSIAGVILAYAINAPWEETVRVMYNCSALVAEGMSAAAGVVSESAKRTGESLLSLLQRVAKFSYEYHHVSAPVYFVMLTIISSYISASSAFAEDLRIWNRLDGGMSPDIPANLFVQICRNTNFPPELLEQIVSFVPDATVQNIPFPNFYDIFYKLQMVKLKAIGAWTLAWQVPSLYNYIKNLSQSNSEVVEAKSF